MSHTFGQCQGSANRHLPPQVGRPVSYPRGPFHADLTPTLWTKLRGEAPGALYLGLLTRCPNADGDHHEELCAPGYSRHPIQIGPLDGRYETNVNALSLDLAAGCEPVLHVGLFDEVGVLRYYGVLAGIRYATGPATRFEFPAYALRIMRLRPRDALRHAAFRAL